MKGRMEGWVNGQSGSRLFSLINGISEKEWVFEICLFSLSIPCCFFSRENHKVVKEDE